MDLSDGHCDCNPVEESIDEIGSAGDGAIDKVVDRADARVTRSGRGQEVEQKF